MLRVRVLFTENFDKNLKSIRRFQEEREAEQLFDQLVNELLETIIPNLERFPDMGTNLLTKVPRVP